MLRSAFAFARLGLALLALAIVGAGNLSAQVVDDPAMVDEDYEVQGEYTAKLAENGVELQVGLQVIALGEGKFQAVAYRGGLPGAGWEKDERVVVDGARDGNRVVFKNDEGRGVWQDGKIELFRAEGQRIAVAEKVERKSPTLGRPAPEGATLVFDGTSVDDWQDGRMTDDGLLMEGTTTRQEFGSFELHIEFRLPYQPTARGQGRGNSGIYFQGRYETQMLDSFGLTGEDNECGGLYSIKAPDVNMCLPPLIWQTYDVVFTAATYDGDQLVTNPRLTVKHNGVVIHDDVELPGDRSTTAAPVAPGPNPGPIHLQNHGNPVRYRNIWIVEKK